MLDPLLILAATPYEQTKIKNFFQSDGDSVKELLRNPGGLRYAGWDLETLDNPRIIKGEYWEVRNGDRKYLNLYEDGTFIFRASAGSDFLGWPRKEKEFNEHPRLNPMGLIEVTYNFVNFYAKLVPRFVVQPTKIKFMVEIKNAFLEKTKIYLLPYGLNAYGWLFDSERYPAPENNMKRECEIDTDVITSSVAYIAYRIVENVYLWFGLEPLKIPYTLSDAKGQKYIDIEQIKKK